MVWFLKPVCKKEMVYGSKGMNGFMTNRFNDTFLNTNGYIVPDSNCDHVNGKFVICSHITYNSVIIHVVEKCMRSKTNNFYLVTIDLLWRGVVRVWWT